MGKARETLSERMMIRMSPSQRKMIERAAKRGKISVGEFLRRAAEQRIDLLNIWVRDRNVPVGEGWMDQ